MPFKVLNDGIPNPWTPCCMMCAVCVKGFGLSSHRLMTSESFVHDGVPYSLKHGDVILASITGCTNATSSSTMLAAGNSTNISMLKLVRKCLNSCMFIRRSLQFYKRLQNLHSQRSTMSIFGKFALFISAVEISLAAGYML